MIAFLVDLAKLLNWKELERLDQEADLFPPQDWPVWRLREDK